MSHGKRDWVVEDNIKRGLHLNKKGQIILPSGKQFSGSKIQTNGYINIHLFDEAGNQYGFQIARIICWLTYGPPPKGYVVDHKNRDKKDNRPSNLRWATHSDNLKNMSDENKERHLSGLKKGQLLKGSDVGNSKITEEIVEEMFKLRSEDKWPHKDIAAKFNISRCHVTDILNRKKGKWDWVNIPKKHLVNKRKDQKLFEKDILKIEKAICLGKMKQKDIAKKFGVSAGKISTIKSRMKL